MRNLRSVAPRISFMVIMLSAALALSTISGSSSGQDVVTDGRNDAEALRDPASRFGSPETPELRIELNEFAAASNDETGVFGAESATVSVTTDSTATTDGAVDDDAGPTTTVAPASAGSRSEDNSEQDDRDAEADSELSEASALLPADPNRSTGSSADATDTPGTSGESGTTTATSTDTGTTAGTVTNSGRTADPSSDTGSRAGTSGDTGGRSGPSGDIGNTDTTTVGTTTTTAQRTTTTASDTIRDGTRSPLRWPYPADSIWNHPLGADADLVPLNMVLPSQKTLNVEEDILIYAPTATKRSIYKTTAAWQDGVSRCGARTSEVVVSDVPIPGGFVTDPNFHGRKPNHSAAIVLPDYTLFETQPLHICTDGTVVSQFAARAWRGDSILTGGQGGSSGGAHGGSGMSAFGGTIRLGEWVPGGTIPHAVKLEVNAAENLSRSNGGYRWPALNADKYAQSRYGGHVTEARMGALLALPQSFDVNQLKSEPARILAKTLKGYGGYVVDDTAWSAAAIAVEWSPEGRVSDEFARVWGFPLDGHRSKSNGSQAVFLGDMETIFRNLHVVNDNRPGNVGGAGARVAPWAPPFPDGTGGR